METALSREIATREGLAWHLLTQLTPTEQKGDTAAVLDLLSDILRTIDGKRPPSSGEPPVKRI